MTTITLSSKGQLVIPVSVRKKMNLKAGDQFTVEVDQDSKEITLHRIESFEEVTEKINSWIKPGTEVLNDTRGLYRTRDMRNEQA